MRFKKRIHLKKVRYLVIFPFSSIFPGNNHNLKTFSVTFKFYSLDRLSVDKKFKTYIYEQELAKKLFSNGNKAKTNIQIRLFHF